MNEKRYQRSAGVKTTDFFRDFFDRVQCIKLQWMVFSSSSPFASPYQLSFTIFTINVAFQLLLSFFDSVRHCLAFGGYALPLAQVTKNHPYHIFFLFQGACMVSTPDCWHAGLLWQKIFTFVRSSYNLTLEV